MNLVYSLVILASPILIVIPAQSFVMHELVPLEECSPDKYFNIFLFVYSLGCVQLTVSLNIMHSLLSFLSYDN